MTTGKGRPRTAGRRLLFSLLLIVLVAGVAEGLAALALETVLPQFGTLRSQLLHPAEVTPCFQNTIGQSYLNYIPSPGYSDEHGVQHNPHGYRGEMVPVRRAAGTLRVLCLGGSTTYGWGVNRPVDAYPAQLEAVIRKSLPDGWSDVEVINAGLPWGTSAELLTHYHFKFHYYQPDAVIIHAGLNDAQAFFMDHYHPDYSHCRRQMGDARALPGKTRWLLRSRVFCAFFLPLVYGLHPSRPTFNRDSQAAPATAWFEPAARSPGELPVIGPDRIAFVHNVRALIREVRADGGRVLLVPVRPAPDSDLPYLASIELHERLLRKLGQSEGVAFTPFPADSIAAASWTDEMHVDAEGCRKKAGHIARPLLELLGQ